jgi:hypothetical protein
VIAELGMAISLTCTCGARLEIDDAFAGKTIPCPDCQRPLNTSPSVPVVPDRPSSPLALASLIMALVGSFTLIGSVAAIVVGYLALRQNARAPDRYGDVRFARAGIAVGAVGLLLTLVALWSGDVLGIDALLREWRYSSDVDYKADVDGFFSAVLGREDSFGIQRPSRSWGKLKARDRDRDSLTLLSPRDDAYLLCLPVTGEADEQVAREKAGERLRQSDLFKNLSRASDAQQSPEPEAKPFAEGKREGDQTLDVRIGGYERTFLLRVVKVRAEIYLLAGGARKERFARLADDFLKAFDSFKQREP